MFPALGGAPCNPLCVLPRGSRGFARSGDGGGGDSNGGKGGGGVIGEGGWKERRVNG